jgi:homoserine kinase type II
MALFDFLEGEEPAINKAVIIAIAEALPQLHAIEDWKHHEALRQDSYIQFSKCLDLIEQFQKAKYQYPKLFQDFKKHTLLHQDILTVDLPKGLIHGDLFPDNTIFQGDTLIGFLDFEDAGMAPLLVDIAMTINGFCFEENRLQADRMAIFLDAYNSIRPIRTLEAKWLMKHIRASILMLIRWHLSCIMEKPRERSLQRAQYLMKRLEMLG